MGSTALCVAMLIASEFLPVSLLTPIAADLQATQGSAGQAISMPGLFAVLWLLQRWSQGMAAGSGGRCGGEMKAGDRKAFTHPLMGNQPAPTRLLERKAAEAGQRPVNCGVALMAVGAMLREACR